MRVSALPIAFLAAGTTAAAASNSTVTCVDGLYILVGRGTGEPAGPGVSKVVANKIADQITGSKVVGVDYPAVFANYGDSEQAGAKAVARDVTAYAKKCPKGKMAYLGYSQGAQIASEAFCGGEKEDSELFGDMAALAESVVDKTIVAIVLYGDPSHIVNATYNKGTSKHDGIFARSSMGRCKDYDDILVSYCDTGDIYCDSGNNQTVHGLYLERYGDDIVKYVVDKYKDATSSSGGSGTATTTMTTAAPTSTGAASPTGTGTSSSPTNSPTGSGSPASPSPTNAAAGMAPTAGMYFAVPLALLAMMQLL